MLRPHIITSRFSLRNLVPSDALFLPFLLSLPLSPPLSLSLSISLFLVSGVLTVFLYRRALARWFARSCMHRSQIPSRALGITRGSEEDSVGVLRGCCAKGRLLGNAAPHPSSTVTAPQRVLCNNTETNCEAVGWPKERQRERSCRIEKEKLCESLADVTLLLLQILHVFVTMRS